MEAAGPEFFAGADRFCRVSEALTGDALLAEISGTESAFSENGTFYRVSRQLRGSTLSRYVELRCHPGLRPGPRLEKRRL